ncbi:MAG: hypothetical protein J6A04_00930 [Clostridia bacterium]|nr:hypothetical protein [Clostridia bacterium]
MNIDQELKKEGIEVIKPLDQLNINIIAKAVATKLVKAFPNQGLDTKDLFIRLSKLNMYITKMSGNLSSAKYYYKNHSIYFNKDLDLTNIDVCAIHECIHALQEYRDEKDNLLRLGFCNFTSSSLPGMALNEAAVQLMSSYAIGATLDTVKYFDITLPTYSPSHYALECTLLNQMAYLTGNYDLFNSTLYSNDLFMDKFILLTSKSTFYSVQSNLDKIMDLEDNLSFQVSLLADIEENSKNIAKITNKISKLRSQIQSLFLDTQNLILTSYFDKKFNAISTLVQAEDYRKKLYNFKDYIGYTNDYSFYNEYYVQKMADLEWKRNEIENNAFQTNPALLLVPKKQNLVITFFRKLKKLFGYSNKYEKVIN